MSCTVHRTAYCTEEKRTPLLPFGPNGSLATLPGRIRESGARDGEKGHRTAMGARRKSHHLFSLWSVARPSVAKPVPERDRRGPCAAVREQCSSRLTRSLERQRQRLRSSGSCTRMPCRGARGNPTRKHRHPPRHKADCGAVPQRAGREHWNGQRLRSLLLSSAAADCGGGHGRALALAQGRERRGCGRAARPGDKRINATSAALTAVPATIERPRRRQR
jgi:hypothetical protein